jgi:hypothetical protein
MKPERFRKGGGGLLLLVSPDGVSRETATVERSACRIAYSDPDGRDAFRLGELRYLPRLEIRTCGWLGAKPFGRVYRRSNNTVISALDGDRSCGEQVAGDKRDGRDVLGGRTRRSVDQLR